MDKPATTIDPSSILLRIKSTNRYALLRIFWYFLAELLLVWLYIIFPRFDLDGNSYLFSKLFFIAGMVIFLLALWKYLRIRSYNFVLSCEQLKVTNGVFSKKTFFIELFRIQDYVIEQPFIFRFLSIVNFKIASTDTAYGVVTMKGIRQGDFPQIIRDLVQLARLKYKIIGIE